MATIATLSTSVTAKTGNFEKGMKRAQKIAANFGSDMARHTGTILRAGAAISGLALGATAVLVKRQLEAVDATSKLSRVVGLTTEQLVGYQHAAGLSGLGSEDFQKAVVKMNRTIADAGNGLSTAKRELDSVGLSAEMLAGMSTDQRIKAIADQYNGIGDAATRASFLINVFGRSGLGMGSLFEQGSRGIAKAQREAEKLWLTFNAIDGASVERANDAMGKLGDLVTGVGIRITTQLAPFIEVISNKMLDFGMQGNKSGEVVVNAFNFIIEAIGSALDAFSLLKAGWDAFKMAVNGFAYAVTGLLNVVVKGWDEIFRLFGSDKLSGAVRVIDELAAGYKDATQEAYEGMTDAFGQAVNGENKKKLKTWFAGIKAEAAKTGNAVTNSLTVPAIETPDSLASSATSIAKSSEFRQINLDRVAVGGVSSSKTSKNPQIETTNKILMNIERSIGKGQAVVV